MIRSTNTHPTADNNQNKVLFGVKPRRDFGLGEACHGEGLEPPARPAQDLNITFRDIQARSDEFHQGGIGLTLNRRCGQAYCPDTVTAAFAPVTAGTGAHPDPQQHGI